MLRPDTWGSPLSFLLVCNQLISEAVGCTSNIYSKPVCFSPHPGQPPGLSHQLRLLSPPLGLLPSPLLSPTASSSGVGIVSLALKCVPFPPPQAVAATRVEVQEEDD